MCVGKRGRDKSRVTISLCVTERAARRKGEHVGVVSLHRTSVSRLERRKERREKREEEDRGGCDRAREGQAYASPCVRDRKYEYPARLVWASLRASLFPLSLSLSLGLVTGKRYSGCSRAGAVPTLGRVYVRGAPSMTVEVERDRDE